MDPYLEDPAFWEDFHRRFITQLADYLLEKLPETYDAHIDERVRLVEGAQEHRDVWIKIVHLPERRLVTAIEVFSPSNKEGDGAVEYHAKRVSLYTRHVNLVELALLRGGERLSFAKPLPAGDYYAFVTRGRRRYVDVYPWKLRDRLPTIPIPLQSPDPDISLDLAAVFSGAYERGRYPRRLRYGKPLQPPMSAKDAAWASQIVGDRERS
jgi:hypothetical protein